MISAIDKIAAGRKKYYAFYLEIFWNAIFSCNLQYRQQFLQ